MDVVSAEIVRIVKECDSITDRQKQIYLIYHFAEPQMSMYAIGKKMGISHNLVHREYHRAKEKVTPLIAQWESRMIVLEPVTSPETEDGTAIIPYKEGHKLRLHFSKLVQTVLKVA